MRSYYSRTAPTRPSGDSSNAIATTAFVSGVAPFITPEQFFTGGVDWGPALRAAVAQAQATGRAILLTKTYPIGQDGANPWCLQITSSVQMIGAGVNNGLPSAWIQPLSTVPGTADIIYLNGSSNTALAGIQLVNMQIGQNGGPIAQGQILTPGSAYTNGTYPGTAMTGGSGSGAVATIVVAGNVVTTVTITTPGTGYQPQDILSATIAGGSGFQWTVGQAGLGNRGIYINTNAAANAKAFGYGQFNDLIIYSNQSGQSIFQDNHLEAASTGGMYLTRFVGGHYFGSIELVGTGSDNVIEHIYITGNNNNVSINFQQVAGGEGGYILQNILADGGASLVVSAGVAIIVRDNAIELLGAVHGTQVALAGGVCADFSGAVHPLSGLQAYSNIFSNLTNFTTTIYHVHIGTASNTKIGVNTWITTNATQQASGFEIYNQGTSTTIDANQDYSVGTPAHLPLNDAGSLTNLGVVGPTTSTLNTVPVWGVTNGELLAPESILATVSTPGGLAQQVYSSIALSTAISNTVTPTNFSKLITLPASTLAVGDTVRIRAGGVYSTTATPTLTFQARIGNQVITSQTITCANNAATFGWTFEADCIVWATGVSGTIVSGYGVMGLVGAAMAPATSSGTVAVNTTGTLAIQIWVTWGAASASNTITMYSMTVEILKTGTSN